jgi:hypothetical protein
VLSYLNTPPNTPFNGGDCAPGTYYLLNDYLPGYTPAGQLNTSTPFVVPPQTLPTIAEELSANNITWGYFGQGYNNGSPSAAYCGVCDPFQYVTGVMTTSLKDNLHDKTDFDTEVANGTLPAVSFLNPDTINDGHPASSSLSLFETFVVDAVTEVQNNPQLWNSTVIFVTFDDGGGYYDSGYVQPISFFGDGPRVPMIAISPFAKRGYVSHTYADHASILKFIEGNWQLPTLSARSLDNLPNPITGSSGPYVPANEPAIGDLFELFNFPVTTSTLPSTTTTTLPTAPVGVRPPTLTVTNLVLTILGRTLSHAKFSTKFRFQVLTSGTPVDLGADDVQLHVGTAALTIPHGALKKRKQAVVFHGRFNGVVLQGRIAPLGGGAFRFLAAGHGANLTGTTNPVTVALMVGTDRGMSTAVVKFPRRRRAKSPGS